MTLASVAACGGPGTEASAPAGTGPGGAPFKIDALLALSGNYAPVGQAMAQGARAAVSVINEQGGVFGKPIELNLIDDGGVPTQAATLARKLVADGRPQAVIPGTVTAEILAVVPLLTQSKVFAAQHGPDPSLNDPKKYPYVFGSVYLRDGVGASLAGEFSAKGFKKVSLITAEQTGDLPSRGIKDALQAKGISTEIVSVPVAAVDATSEMQKALDARPDVLVLDAYGGPAGAIMQARTKLNPSVPTYASQNFTAGDLSKIAPASAYAGIRLQCISFVVQDAPVTKTPAFETFFNAIRKETGGTLAFTMNTYVVAYNDVMLSAYAAKLANSTDPAAMTAALEKATPEQMPYFVGPVNFSSNSHYPNYDAPWWTFVEYGGVANSQIIPARS